MIHMPQIPVIEIYTDGSCDPRWKMGAWAVLISRAGEKIILKGTAANTTHNRMELEAVIQAITYVKNNFSEYKLLQVFTDSQYVVKLRERKEQLKNNGFLTKKCVPVQNTDLLHILIRYIDNMDIEFVKIRAHQNSTRNEHSNSIVDKLARKTVRESVKQFKAETCK